MARRSTQQPAEVGSEADDGYAAMSMMASWVSGAETKIGLLVAALTVVAGVVVRQRDAVLSIIDDADRSIRATLALIALAICAAALLMAAVVLVRALRARLLTGAPSRFSLPHLAAATKVDLEGYEPSAARRDAWVQARTLARIAHAKYKAFNTALMWSLGSGAALTAWFFLEP